MTEQEIYQRLQARFDDSILGFESDIPQPVVSCTPEAVGDIAKYLRDDPALSFDRLLCLSGVDYEGLDEKGKGKHREINRYEEDGTVNPVEDPGTGDLAVVYHLESFKHHHRLCLSVRVPRETPKIASVGHVWITAQYGERETYDFFGIEFEGNPDLRRLFLPEDWVGWPLRKDYEMPVRYNDVPLEGLGLAVRDEQ